MSGDYQASDSFGDAGQRISDTAPTPEEMLERLEGASSAVSTLWSHVMSIPAWRPELRVLLCHLWDGCTNDTNLARRLGVHRHTVRRWRRELQNYLVRRAS